MNNQDENPVKMLDKIEEELNVLRAKSNLRVLPDVVHDGGDVIVNGQRMINFSSNDYLGLGVDVALRKEFMESLTADSLLMTSSSSRLLTGNFAVYAQLEALLCQLYGSQGALIFNSGYHANIGILSAISNDKTLILADKLVHASVIDGIKLSSAAHLRYRHNDLEQLARLLEKYAKSYQRIVVVTESIFSMDGDEAICKDWLL